MKSNNLERHRPTDVASEWLAECKTPEERQELKEYLLNSTRAFDLLKKMVQKRYDSEVSVRWNDYDTPSWANKQAHANGRLEAFEEVFKLLP